MRAKALMFQGTGSDVGKSLLVAGLCRLLANQGVRVAPFKPQNMSNNAAACADGGEIGRAQALQALACRLDPRTDFNPVLLKPQSDRTSQVVVQGKVSATLGAADYMTRREGLMAAVKDSFNRLSTEFDMILVEGAGSPAEVNLRKRDIANMGFAREYNIPVCLIGDIERGGVIAAVAGTKLVIDPKDAALIIGFAINKFRGDPALFTEGVITTETHTGWPCFGVIPWLRDAHKLPPEDAVALSKPQSGGTGLKIVAPTFARIANFDDADPLRQQPGVDFQFIPAGTPIPQDADVVALLGSKSTIGDLQFLRDQGWDHDIIAHARAGKRVLGVCGGYQMLGRYIHDPDGLEGPACSVPGLGLLDIETTMTGEKAVRPISGTCAISGAAVKGYEIHIGRSTGPDCARPFAQLGDTPDGARNKTGLVEGTYLHGLFADDQFRAKWLSRAGAETDPFNYDAEVDAALDSIAAQLAGALDTDALFAQAAQL